MICQPCREKHEPDACLYPLSCTCQHKERGKLLQFPTDPTYEHPEGKTDAHL